ncbi:MAG: SIS domain-containing protein [Promethearchaeota archaeon]
MNLTERANQILEIQKEAINKLFITKNYSSVILEIQSKISTPGLVVTTGMGKSGIIAQKMSATMASIGIPSFYVHPAESLHGDLGRISANDLIIIFSHSGTTGEIEKMLSHLHSINNSCNRTILISSCEKSKFDVTFLISYGKITESCQVDKVPSTSTTLMLIIADILAITAAEAAGFDESWFKARHPGGAIGDSYNRNI